MSKTYKPYRLDRCCDPPMTPACRWCDKPWRVSQYLGEENVVNQHGDFIPLSKVPDLPLIYFVIDLEWQVEN